MQIVVNEFYYSVTYFRSVERCFIISNILNDKIYLVCLEYVFVFGFLACCLKLLFHGLPLLLRQLQLLRPAC